MTHPVITVIVVAHNHERFIRQALDGVLDQQVNVPVEIIVSEDASTDRTREIVADAAARHPAIRPILSSHNLNSNEVTYRAIRASRGRYLALMDGDDVWFRTDKLARQWRFLEDHPECSVCFHDVRVIDDAGATLEEARLGDRVEAITGMADLLGGNYVPGSAPMFRRETVAAMPDWLASAPYADWTLMVAAARHGAVGYLSEPLGAYRVHRQGSWSSLGQRVQAEGIVGFFDHLEPHFWPEHRETLRHCRAAWRLNLLKLFEQEGDLSGYASALDDGLRCGDIVRTSPAQGVSAGALTLSIGEVKDDSSLRTLSAAVGHVDEARWGFGDRQLVVIGWGPFGTSAPASLEVSSTQAFVDAALVRLTRPDVAKRVDPRFDRSGFWIQLRSERPMRAPVHLTTATEDGSRRLLAVIDPTQRGPRDHQGD